MNNEIAVSAFTGSCFAETLKKGLDRSDFETRKSFEITAPQLGYARIMTGKQARNERRAKERKKK